jgi:hypothetical protein
MEMPHTVHQKEENQQLRIRTGVAIVVASFWNGSDTGEFFFKKKKHWEKVHCGIFIIIWVTSIG